MLRSSQRSAPDEDQHAVAGVCTQDCPDACVLLAEVRAGRLVGLAGDEEHDITRGFLCVKARHFVERVYHPDRLLYPLRRVGPKGMGRFERIGWDEAIAEIAERFTRLVQDHGGESILRYSFSGTLGKINNEGMDRRFFHRLGASQLLRTICTAAGDAGYAYTVGRRASSDIETLNQSAFIILWGHNAAETSSHLLPLIRQARAAGATLVVIDPRRSATAKLADWHLQPKPGTDAALALAMMQVIIQDGLYDAAFVDAHTHGFEALAEHVANLTSNWADGITGIPADEIRTLAHRYATETPSFIRIGWGVQRNSNGGMAVRAITCLPGLTGSWLQAGGGAFLSNSAAVRLNYQALQRPDLMPGPRRTINMVQLADALLEADPPIYGLYVYNSNPAAVTPDQRRVRKGLLREDLFVVVHEIFQTDTADYADIVLPAATQFEVWDLMQPHGAYLSLNRPVVPPQGEAKSNCEVFRLLAKAMGFADPCFDDAEQDLIAQLLNSDDPALDGITFERLLQEGWVRAKLPQPYWPFPEGEFGTPTGKLEFYSPRLAAEGQPPLPVYQPLHEGRDGTPDLYHRYPLTLLSPASRHTVSSSYANTALAKTREARPTLEIHPQDAHARGIEGGDLVRVYNDRGECWLWARLTEETLPGVVVSRKGLWAKLSPGGGTVNQLTSTRLSDLGGGATFHSTLVEVGQGRLETETVVNAALSSSS